MPKYEVTITTTQKEEKEMVETLVSEMWLYARDELGEESGLHYTDIDNLKAGKAALRELKRAAKEMLPLVIEKAIKSYNHGGGIKEVIYEEYIYNDTANPGWEIAVKNATATVMASDEFQKAVKKEDARLLEERKAALLKLAEKVGATVTFPEDEE